MIIVTVINTYIYIYDLCGSVMMCARVEPDTISRQDAAADISSCISEEDCGEKLRRRSTFGATPWSGHGSQMLRSQYLYLIS
jgi:hypothetical protein